MMIDMELPIIFDDAEIEAAEIMGLMLREGQSLKVQRTIAKRLRDFKIKDRKPVIRRVADSLAILRGNPELDQRLESRGKISEAQIARVARAIGRTADNLGEGCDEPCDTDGGTCICIELHWDQARAALEAAKDKP